MKAKSRQSLQTSSQYQKIKISVGLALALSTNLATALAVVLPSSLVYTTFFSAGPVCAADIQKEDLASLEKNFQSDKDLLEHMNKKNFDSEKLKALEKFARALKQEKNYRALEPLDELRLNLFRRVYEDGNLAYAIDELADTKLALGKLNEAEALYKESLKINKEISHVWGKPVPNYQTRDLARQLTGLGHVAMKRGEFKAAENYFKEYFDGVKKEEQGLRAIYTPQATLELADCLLAQHKDDEAIKLLKEASQLNVNAHASFSQAALLNKLADQLEKTGEKNQAAQYRAIASSLKKNQERLNKSGLDY
ncbi:MAG: hypothetical protein K2Y32_15785 [Candidatus Obscuribacterales bacterium]|nr:hypothetical protein [Candidatus Obscuribacterales bacterium]